MIPWIDAHTHFVPAQKDILALIDLSAEKEHFPDETLSSRLLFSYGVHPAESATCNLEKNTEKWNDPRIHVIGECGLDRSLSIPLEIQSECFLAQLEIAQKQQKPMVIHCVRCYSELLSFRKKYWKNPEIPWLLHGFRANENIGRDCLKYGCILSLSPVWLLHLNEFPQWLPDDSFVLETDDDPVLDISAVYAHVCRLRGENMETLKERLFSTFRRVFPECVFSRIQP
ncbi:MAG: TatD family hydrolase [Lentisphaeria bacterium]|nr:TatD family hydrolase [Lentisphaeria bacterium]